MNDIDINEAEQSSTNPRYTVTEYVTAEQHKALLAKADELTAELAKVREQLTAANRRADGLANDLRSAVNGNTNYANENARVRQQRDGLIADLTDAGNEVDLLTAENTRLRPVVEAAKAWRFSGDTAGGHRRAIAALNAAVDALPKTEATR